MTTTNKLDLRTCAIEQLCEWVAVNIMEWRKVDGLNGWTCWRCAKGHLWVSEMFATSLDAVAAVEAKARPTLERSGRRAMLHVYVRGVNGLGGILAAGAWWSWEYPSGAEFSRAETIYAPTEPEARLRAVALAWDAASRLT